MFREALRLDSSVPDHHWRLGKQLMNMQQEDEALTHLRNALALAPDHKGQRQHWMSMHEMHPTPHLKDCGQAQGRRVKTNDIANRGA
ncbi:hypothetical protein EBB79_22330 (plasmid) [Parasedimentitalea marina]|uniref:Uncharacterized protein n=1 Tax=Parasedimentitalea marina TaxID=2483033 RepID=A0A3T0N9H6_9RHOB|nr:hypothetical protein EBB79_22330 [Parasedimentitalea marina]